MSKPTPRVQRTLQFLSTTRKDSHVDRYTTSTGRDRRTEMGTLGQCRADRCRGKRWNRDLGRSRGYLRGKVGCRARGPTRIGREGAGHRDGREAFWIEQANRYGHRALSRKRFAVDDVFAEGPRESYGRKRLGHAVG